MGLMNRLGNAKNKFQGTHLKVLTVCSAGILRSATAAHILSATPYNFNTRNCGVFSDYALIEIDKVLLHWADVVICMEQEHADAVGVLVDEMWQLDDKEIHVLGVGDNYEYRDPELVSILDAKFKVLFKDKLELV